MLDELSLHDAIKSLWGTATFTLTANIRNYNTRTITGLAAPHFPLDVKRVIVPSWGAVEGYLKRESEEIFVRFRLDSTDSNGNNVQNRPRRWCLTPNEQTLSVDPAPRSDDVVTNGVELYFLKPAAVLAGAANIEEVRQEFIPGIIGGMIRHGLVFQEETLVDRPAAIRDYELLLLRMRGQAARERGRPIRMAFRDV